MQEENPKLYHKETIEEKGILLIGFNMSEPYWYLKTREGEVTIDSLLERKSKSIVKIVIDVYEIDDFEVKAEQGK